MESISDLLATPVLPMRRPVRQGPGIKRSTLEKPTGKYCPGNRDRFAGNLEGWRDKRAKYLIARLERFGRAGNKKQAAKLILLARREGFRIERVTNPT